MAHTCLSATHTATTQRWAVLSCGRQSSAAPSTCPEQPLPCWTPPPCCPPCPVLTLTHAHTDTRTDTCRTLHPASPAPHRHQVARPLRLWSLSRRTHQGVTWWPPQAPQRLHARAGVSSTRPLRDLLESPRGTSVTHSGGSSCPQPGPPSRLRSSLPVPPWHRHQQGEPGLARSAWTPTRGIPPAAGQEGRKQLDSPWGGTARGAALNHRPLSGSQICLGCTPRLCLSHTRMWGAHEG